VPWFSVIQRYETEHRAEQLKDSPSKAFDRMLRFRQLAENCQE
jgi:hypothetical protein